MKTLNKKSALLAALALSASVSGIANAASVTYSGSSAPLAASAMFDDSTSGFLTITLKNTSTAAILSGADVLTGLFFNSSGLTPNSASLGSGSSVVKGAGAYTVGQGWQYKSGGVGFAQDKSSGISASGLGVFGPKGNFATGGVTLGGSDYGLVGTGSVAGSNPSVQAPIFSDTLIFKLAIGTSGFTLASLGNTVGFQYGTSLSEPYFHGTITSPGPVPTPIPAAIWMVGSALFGAFGFARRKGKADA